MELRTNVTWAGILVLIFGLLLVGGAAAYSSLDWQWVGGILSVLGMITGLIGAFAGRSV